MEQSVPYGSIISGFTLVDNTGSGSASQAPGSASQAPGSASQAPGSASQAPGSASQAPGSASQARPAPASQSGSTLAPSQFSPAFLFTSLLDTSTVSKTEKKRTYSKDVSISAQLQNRPMATKEIQIVVPPRQDKSRCEDDPKYNDRKTFAGNLIDRVICGTQDLLKRIGNFF